MLKRKLKLTSPDDDVTAFAPTPGLRKKISGALEKEGGVKFSAQKRQKKEALIGNPLLQFDAVGPAN